MRACLWSTLTWILLIPSALGFLRDLNHWSAATYYSRAAHMTTSMSRSPSTGQRRIDSFPSLASTSRNSSAEDLQQDHVSAVRVGFIGCGTIASAIAKGLAGQNRVPLAHVCVSRRSASKSAALQEQLGSDLVTIYDDNQRVVDDSDIVFLTVLPEQTSTVLQSLVFDAAHHTLVSLVSTSPLDQLARDSQLPTNRVFRMICLPAVATGQGVCLVTPRPSHGGPRTGHSESWLAPLLEALGGMVAAHSPEHMNAMMIPSGLMGTMYGILKNNRDFVMAKVNADEPTGSQNQLGAREATKLVAKYYFGMLVDLLQKLENDSGDEDSMAGSRLLEELIAEQTPGGLNEQGLRQVEALGGMDVYDDIQEGLWERLSGRTKNETQESKERMND